VITHVHAHLVHAGFSQKHLLEKHEQSRHDPNYLGVFQCQKCNKWFHGKTSPIDHPPTCQGPNAPKPKGSSGRRRNAKPVQPKAEPAPTRDNAQAPGRTPPPKPYTYFERNADGTVSFRDTGDWSTRASNSDEQPLFEHYRTRETPGPELSPDQQVVYDSILPALRALSTLKVLGAPDAFWNLVFRGDVEDRSGCEIMPTLQWLFRYIPVDDIAYAVVTGCIDKPAIPYLRDRALPHTVVPNPADYGLQDAKKTFAMGVYDLETHLESTDPKKRGSGAGSSFIGLRRRVGGGYGMGQRTPIYHSGKPTRPLEAGRPFFADKDAGVLSCATKGSLYSVSVIAIGG
jgi:hypothetical protein